MLVGATEGPNRIFLWKISKIWPINGPGTPPMSMMNEKASRLPVVNTQNKCLITKRHEVHCQKHNSNADKALLSKTIDHKVTLHLPPQTLISSMMPSKCP